MSGSSVDVGARDGKDDAPVGTPPGGDHVADEVRPILSLGADARIAFARRDLWIEHGAAKASLDKLEDMLVHPRVEQMPCLLVAAASRNGKSTVLKRFTFDHPAGLDGAGKPHLPVVFMQMPVKPRETDFWSAMLTGMKISHRANAAASVKRQQALANLKAYRCGMLLIDEIHNVLRGGVDEQKSFLVLLKNLTNELMLPIAVAGTREAVRALKTDEQFGDRFDVAQLPRWKLDEGYLSLLATWEALMPLRRASNLVDRAVATKLYDMSDGTIGSLSKLVKAATEAAIRSGSERITLGSLAAITYNPLRSYQGNDL